MPELPDILVYLDAFDRHIVRRTLVRARLVGPFLLRNVDPPLDRAEGRIVRGVSHLGKRIALELSDPDEPYHLPFHLMIAGRFRWLKTAAKSAGDVTRGHVLKDRSLSRLLRHDWPPSAEWAPSS